jgi:glycosyltransferase involved in cell wall biosynthesis
MHIQNKNSGTMYVVAEAHEIEIEPHLHKKQLNVGFLGGITIGKGSKAILEMIKLMAEEDVNFIIMGDILDEDLRDYSGGNVLRAGRYNASNVNLLLANYNIDIACFLPLHEETFCYTLSETLQFGLPAIGTDVGAVGERIKENGYGWVVPCEGTALHTVKILRDILQNPQIIDYTPHETTEGEKM